MTEMSGAGPNRWLMRLAAGVSGLLIAESIFRWQLVDVFVIYLFLMFFVQAGLWGLFLLVAVWAVVYFALRFRALGWAAGKPAAIMLAAVAIMVVVPFTRIVLEIDFRLNATERERVVAMVQAGDPALQPAPVREFRGFSTQTIVLPPQYRHLSKGGGEIVVQRTGTNYKILFYTFRGMLDNFSGFVYAADDSGLLKEDFNGEFKQVERLRENWFFGASW